MDFEKNRIKNIHWKRTYFLLKFQKRRTYVQGTRKRTLEEHIKIQKIKGVHSALKWGETQTP